MAFSESSTFAQNHTAGSGDWFDNLIWQDLSRRQKHPEGDHEQRVNICGGSQVQVSTGHASVEDLLFIGDGGGGLTGDF